MSTSSPRKTSSMDLVRSRERREMVPDRKLPTYQHTISAIRGQGSARTHLVPARLDPVEQLLAVPEELPTQTLFRDRSLDFGDDELALRERWDGLSELLSWNDDALELDEHSGGVGISNCEY
jgi:hypothetical protein